METQNEIYKTQISELRLEKTELTGYLQRCWNEEKNIVKALEEKVHVVSEVEF